MEWTTETNQKQLRECWNEKKKSTQEGQWKEKYKWNCNSDKKENISDNSDKQNISERMLKTMEKTICSPWGERSAVAKAKPQKLLVS